jgi:hypothetical protein
MNPFVIKLQPGPAAKHWESLRSVPAAERKRHRRPDVACDSVVAISADSERAHLCQKY